MPPDGSSSDAEAGAVHRMHAAKAKWYQVSPLLEPFCVPCSEDSVKKPFIHNASVARTSQEQYPDSLSEYHKDCTDDEIFLDMLGFLFNGNPRKIQQATDFMDRVEKNEGFKAMMARLDILDSHPSPASSEAIDCETWYHSIHKAATAFDEQSPSRTFIGGVQKMAEVMMIIKRDNQLAQNESQHSNWRKLLDTLNLGITEQFGAQLSYWVKGHFKDEFSFNGHLGTLEVHAQPDAVMESSVPGCMGQRLRAVTYQFNSQMVRTDKIFQLSPCSSPEEENNRERNCEDNSTEKQSRDSLSDETHNNYLKEKWDHTATCSKIEIQHLLELIASAMQNYRVVNELPEGKLKKNMGSASEIAGIMVFHNAIVLSKLMANVYKIEHPSKFAYKNTFGKYQISEKILNPWKGPWKTVVKYSLVCSQMLHDLD